MAKVAQTARPVNNASELGSPATLALPFAYSRRARDAAAVRPPELIDDRNVTAMGVNV